MTQDQTNPTIAYIDIFKLSTHDVYFFVVSLFFHIDPTKTIKDSVRILCTVSVLYISTIFSICISPLHIKTSKKWMLNVLLPVFSPASAPTSSTWSRPWGGGSSTSPWSGAVVTGIWGRGFAWPRKQWLGAYTWQGRTDGLTARQCGQIILLLLCLHV